MREKNDSTLMNRYRLMWNEIKYEPGEVKVVAYDSNGYAAMDMPVNMPENMPVDMPENMPSRDRTSRKRSGLFGN